jgi:hypothetical protein
MIRGTVKTAADEFYYTVMFVEVPLWHFHLPSLFSFQTPLELEGYRKVGAKGEDVYLQ